MEVDVDPPMGAGDVHPSNGVVGGGDPVEGDRDAREEGGDGGGNPHQEVAGHDRGNTPRFDGRNHGVDGTGAGGLGGNHNKNNTDRNNMDRNRNPAFEVRYCFRRFYM